MPSASSALLLFASLLGAQARVLPDACPASCTDTSTYGIDHHRLQDLSHCGKTVHYNEVFRIDGGEEDDVAPEISVCSAGDVVSVEEDKRNLRESAEHLIDFHVLYKTDGLPLSKFHVDHFTRYEEDRGTGIPPTSPYWVEMELQPSNTTLGFYAGKDVDPTTLHEAILQWGKAFWNGTSTFAAQYCGMGQDKTIGFVIDGNGRDKGVVEEYMNLWNQDKCAMDFERGFVMEDVPVLFRNDVWQKVEDPGF